MALKTLGARYGLVARIAEAVNIEGASDKISSSTVRAALREGDVKAAAGLLGRPFAIEGEVSARAISAAGCWAFPPPISRWATICGPGLASMR
jgi:FAD synthase